MKQIEFNLPTHTLRQPKILRYVQIIIDFSILFLNAPLRRFPRASNERIFIGAVCLLSLNIVSLFQSSLATVFIKPMYYRNIDSLQQFAETQKRILIKYPAMLTDLFPEDSSEVFRILNSRMVLVAKPELTATDVINLGMATVTRKINSKLSSDDENIHLIPDCPRSYNIAYVLAKNSFYLETVNAIILDIAQFGFIKKWIDEEYFKAQLKGLRHHPPITARARVIRVDDLQLAFAILAVGLALGSIILLIEKLTASSMCYRRISASN